MTRRFSMLGRLGLWGAAFGGLAAPLACAADVQLGTREGAGEGSGADSSSGGDGATDAGGTGGKVGAGGSTNGRGGSANGSGGSPTNGGTNASGATSNDGGTGLGGTNPGSGGSELGGTGGIPTEVCSTQLTATEQNDYSFSSSLAFDVTKVKPNTNLSYDWSGLTTDWVGNPIDLDQAVIDVALWAMSADEFKARWPQSNATSWIQDAQDDLVMVGNLFPTGETHGTLRDLTWSSPPFPEDVLDYFDPATYPPEKHVYTVSAETGGGSWVGTRMLAAFVLDEDSDETEVRLDSSSAHVTYSVDLRSLVPHSVPFGVPGLTIDWSNLAQSGLGQPFEPNQVTYLEIASYPLTLVDLESAAFMKRDTMADGRWIGNPLDSSSYRLSATYDPSAPLGTAGHFFPGIDATHTWLLTLGCDFCDAIAPMYMSVLHTCSADKCGDGIVQPDLAEACDDGINAGDYGGCGPRCQLGPRCGDGEIQTAEGEECDSGDLRGQDGVCTVGCKVAPELQ